MNNELKDSTTGFAKRAIDILFVQNPKGTSMGIVFGFVLEGLAKSLEPTLKTLESVSFSDIGTIYYVSFGIFIFNIKNFFQRTRFNDSIEEAFAYIEEMKKNKNLNAWEIKQAYRALTQKVLDNVELDEPTKEKADNIIKAAVSINKANEKK